MDRVKSGIPGFDQLVGGGIPKGFNLLVTGMPGTGKTIFGLQYLYNGALQGEKGMYITLDSRLLALEEQCTQFGWDLNKMRGEKKLFFLEVPLNRQLRINLFKFIEDRIREDGVTRIVFDSLSSFVFNINQFVMELPSIDNLASLPEEDKKYLGENMLFKQDIPPDVLQREKPDPKFYESNSYKRIVYLVLREFSMLGTTNILITNETYNGEELTVDGVSEFASDGIVHLRALEGEQGINTISVPKMRLTKINRSVFEFRIDEHGITVKS